MDDTTTPVVPEMDPQTEEGTMTPPAEVAPTEEAAA